MSEPHGARTLHPDAPGAVQHLANRLLPDAEARQ